MRRSAIDGDFVRERREDVFEVRHGSAGSCVDIEDEPRINSDLLDDDRTVRHGGVAMFK